jgi:hypothetical protein
MYPNRKPFRQAAADTMSAAACGVRALEQPSAGETPHPVLGDGYAEFGERHRETDRW